MWSKNYKQCGGAFQSPVDIVRSETQFDANLKPVGIMAGADVQSWERQMYRVRNDNHSMEMTFPEGLWKVALENDTSGMYCVTELHFHWGANGTLGSEHTLDGNSFSFEAHLVMHNCEIYGTLDNALISPHGVAVLGFWVQEKPDVKLADSFIGVMGQLGTTLQTVLDLDSPILIPAFNLSELMNLVDPGAYYRYMGSLTTPPCIPNVMWTVFTKVIPMSTAQQASSVAEKMFKIANRLESQDVSFGLLASTNKIKPQ
ncbi:unnamed protein product [Echinostoma caproni]|uniref:Carbonic anhydrase n=1 Tax=Echinostoma caproni TaxID=27848 RepID=A0A183AH12_9TREM|nr:unnamed protein product [Echinostoma caproni]